MSSADPIRVLRIIARLNVGGPALHVSYLTKGLDERGYETVLAAGVVAEGEGSMEYVARDLGVAPVPMPELQREIAFGVERRAVTAVRELIREHRPHIIHTHTAKAGAIGRTAAMLAGRDRPPVVVHTFHGHVLRGYFGPVKTAAFRQIERRLARSTDALIAVSPEVRDDLVALGVAPASKIAVIRLGLDLASRTQVEPGVRESLRRELGVPEGRFLVGWLGRMTEIKCVDVLIEAAALAYAAGADLDLVLVGDGPLRPALEAHAMAVGLADRVHFLGFHEDVAPIYAAVDAVALTSANEGTPVTVIESLAAGKPVVATAVGGVPDVVREGETGFLVPVGNTAALADRFVRLATDRALGAALGARGAEVLSRYAVPRLLDDVDELYRSLLGTLDPATRRTYTALSRPLVPTTPADSPARRARRQMRVVLVSQYFPPEVGATQSRMQSFADHLAAQGHDVTVITEFPNHPHGVIPEAYHGRIVEDDRSNAYRVLRVWVRASTQKTQQTRMEFYLSFMALATAVTPRIGRADVVVATSPPLFAGLAGAAIARLMRTPFVLDVRDLWPAAAISLGQLSNPTAARGSALVEQRLYREAAAVIAVTQPFCDHIDGIRGRPPATVLLPNGTLPQFFDALPGTARAELGIPDDRFLATFAGNFGIAQALGKVIDAAELTGPEVEFALVGEGPIRDALVADADARNLENVHFHPQVPLERIPPFLAASDALLVTLSGHPTFADFVPSKMVDFMASGRPVVLAAAGEPARILEAAGGGIAVPPEDPEALARALLELKADPASAQRMGARGREFARGRLRSVQAGRLEELLLDLIGR